jgi:hypothetical protein
MVRRHPEVSFAPGGRDGADVVDVRRDHDEEPAGVERGGRDLQHARRLGDVLQHIVDDDGVCRLLAVEHALNDGNSGPDAEIGKPARRFIGDVSDRPDGER